MMNRFIILLSIPFFMAGCGYTTGSMLPPRLKTIHIQDFKNNINYTTEETRDIYLPLLEVKIRNAVVDRFLFDGNLRIAKEDAADLVLSGELISYDRQPLRYVEGSDDDVLEYRVQMTVNLVLMDTQENAPFWTAGNFVGEATYFVSGPLAQSEEITVDEVITDLARRIVERTIENW